MFGGRPTCDEQWVDDDTVVQCERYAVVTVAGTHYCKKHVRTVDVSDR